MVSLTWVKRGLVPLFIILLLFLSAQAQDESVAPFATGSITNEDAVQILALDVARDGSNLTIDMRPPADQTETTELDTFLYLLDSNNRIVAENDDAAKGAVNSLIEYPEAQAGSYRIVATRYGLEEGDSTGDYELYVTVTRQSDAAEIVYDTSDEALAAAGFPDLETADNALWTVLVYYGGDNNLEPAILADLNEMEIAGGSNRSVRVLALVDNESATENNDWSTARLFEVTTDTSRDHTTVYPPTVDSPYLTDLGEINTSGGEAFAQFLVWGVRHFPANRYVLAIGSHGAGWRGLITDDTTFKETRKKVILPLPQLTAALEAAKQEAGVEKFDLIINDACLMSSVEYHLAVADYFRYSLASPEIVVNPALDMTQFLTQIKTDTNADLEKIGRGLVTTYIQRDVLGRATSDAIYLTSTLTDLADYSAVKAALDDFADVFDTDPTLYTSILNQARSAAYVYSSYVGGEELIDLGSLMQLVVRTADEPNIVVAAQAVLVALRNTNIYSEGGSRVAESVSNYQNIFFPDSSAQFNNNANRYFTEANLGSWGNMLRTYFNELTPQVFSLTNERAVPFHPPVIPDVLVAGSFPPQDALDAQSAQLGMDTAVAVNVELVGRNMNAAYYTFEKIEQDATGAEVFVRYSEELVLSDVPSGVAKIRSTWDATLPFIQFGADGNFELLRLSGVDPSTGLRVASLQGRYRLPDSDVWNDVTLVFDATNYLVGGSFQRVVNRSAETGAAADVTIPDGAIFQANRYVLEAGKLVVSEGNTYTWAEGGPTWEWRPAPNGDYNISVVVTTSGGSATFSKRATINNDNADLDLRADALSLAHMSTPRPRDWTQMEIVVLPGDFRAFRSSSPDGNSNFTLYYRFFSRYPELFSGDTLPDLEDTLYLFEDTALDQGYDKLTITNVPSRTTVQGRDALLFNYRYVEDGKNTNGRGYLVYQDTDFGGAVFLIGAESTTGVLQNFDLLVNNIRFWEFENIDIADTVVEVDADGLPLEGRWRGQPEFVQKTSDDQITVYDIVGGTEYYVPVTYGAGAVEDINGTLWATYYRNNNPATGTFLRVTAFTGDALENGTDYILNYLSQNVGIPASVIETNRYRGKYFTWFSVSYSGTRDEQAIYGRYYVTTLQDGDVIYYILYWFETPFGEDIEATRNIVGNELEPIVDSFKIP
jgi:hypothetical protein